MRTPASWVLFRESQREANVCYSNVRARYTAKCKERHTTASSTRNRWSTLKESVLGVSSSIPPLQSDGGALVSDAAGKAALLSNFLIRSSPEMLLAVLHPAIASPSFVLLT